MSALRRILARILLTIVFFLIVTPVALVLKIIGFDPLALRRPRSVASFWSERRNRQGHQTRFDKLS